MRDGSAMLIDNDRERHLGADPRGHERPGRHHGELARELLVGEVLRGSDVALVIRDAPGDRQDTGQRGTAQRPGPQPTQPPHHPAPGPHDPPSPKRAR
ncbi:hypothetical protein G1H11_22295 [Phytoactinopolyspora alkaliphila]|uniref:Uncharacterized protein n=1 Tax=Phytoactinopolyspora alkaliphila TaxID=1783498 RepID=A0A6N9YSL5_9ACTN|nr:hypothetical protein [Phytoactinopolyspora alkaliphila]NED98033.1 hypothetical protein [Phytoactinopolyspora alkaliphila]